MPDDIKFKIYEYCVDYTSILKEKKERQYKIIRCIVVIVICIVCYFIGLLLTGRSGISMFLINVVLGYFIFVVTCSCLLCMGDVLYKTLTGSWGN